MTDGDSQLPDAGPPAAGAAQAAAAQSTAVQPPAAAPDAFAAPMERLDRRVVAYWYIADVLRALFVTAALVAAAEFWRAREPQRAWASPLAWWLGGAMLVLALVTPPLAYARWRFSVDDRLLSMRYGILFLEERRVPVPRMQHVDLLRGPIERLFGLATLLVYTAGNEGSAFRVPGLSRARAEALRDCILAARGQDVI